VEELVEVVAAVTDTCCRRAGGPTSHFGSWGDHYRRPMLCYHTVHPEPGFSLSTSAGPCVVVAESRDGCSGAAMS
jgi:hypothetical protein